MGLWSEKDMRIMYLIHVNWDWIFQRPQILEKMLEEDYDVVVYNKKVLFKPSVSKNSIRPKNMKVMWQLPKEDKIPLVKRINRWIIKQSYKRCKDYDAVWVCHPSLFSFLPNDYSGKIIYDCMDNHAALANATEKEVIRKSEECLVKRADLIFATSERLIKVIPGLEDAILVRNGYNARVYKMATDNQIKMKYKLGYIGTISSWFDYLLLKESLKKVDNIEYHLVGPVEYIDNDLANNKNIIFDGVIEHAKLFDTVKEYDALIMPFKVNDIILAVDPVKLYEYIAWGKCIISVWYPEIDRFSPYVYFYKTYEEYFSLMDVLSKDGFKPKYTDVQRCDFLNENTWKDRYKIINKRLNDLL